MSIATSPDAARWTPLTTSQPSFSKGRAPRMTYIAWHRSQRTELGASARDAWYRRCLTRGCRIWAGPYCNPSEAKDDGMWHQHYAHDLPSAWQAAS